MTTCSAYFVEVNVVVAAVIVAAVDVVVVVVVVAVVTVVVVVSVAFFDTLAVEADLSIAGVVSATFEFHAVVILFLAAEGFAAVAVPIDAASCD